MKMTKTTGKIDYKERMNSSVNGNPRYQVEVTTASKYYPLFLSGKTSSDAMFCYGNWREGDACEIWYHITKSGNVVFDHINKIG